jgi:hypothetical protein
MTKQKREKKFFFILITKINVQQNFFSLFCLVIFTYIIQHEIDIYILIIEFAPGQSLAAFANK